MTNNDGAAAGIFEKSNLTRSQFLIWLGQTMNPDQPLYNMAMAFRFSGKIQVEAFCEAFETLVSGNDALRTVVLEENGVPKQHVAQDFQYETPVLDFTNRTNPDEAANKWMQKQAATVLDISIRLFDSHLIKISEDDFIWYFNQHHLMNDGWSVTVIYRTMADYYKKVIEKDTENLSPPINYSQYLDWEKSFREREELTRAKRYWSEQSLSAPRLNFFGKSPSANLTKSERTFVDLGKERTDKLKALAQEPGIRSFTLDLSLFYIFSTVLNAFLARVCRQDRVVFGTPSHNRSKPEFRSAIGLFIEMFPLQVTVHEDDSFDSLLKKTVVESQNFLRNALPGASSVETNSAFNVVLNFIHASFGNFDDLSMQSTWIHPGHVDRGNVLRIQVHDFDGSGSMKLHFDFSTDLFERSERENSIAYFIRILDAFIENRAQSLQNIPFLTATQEKQLHTLASGDRRPLKQHTVLEDLIEKAHEAPEAIALRLDEVTCTYSQLNKRANQLAHELIDRGVKPGDIVGVYLPRGMDLIPTLLGIWKTGAAFLPFDISIPPARVEKLIAESEAVLLISDDSISEISDGLVPVLLNLEQQREQINTKPEDDLPVVIKPDSLAYVIFTSGSTGLPKGVSVSHASLSGYLSWSKDTYAAEKAISMPLFTALSADLTITSLFLPLISGGQVIIYPQEKGGNDFAIVQVAEDDAVDTIKLTPSHLALVREKLSDSKNLQSLILGGEDLKTALVTPLLSTLGNRLAIYNEYGPTEATVGCMIHQMTTSDISKKSVPIGKPIDNARIYLLDENHQLVAQGSMGRIYIGGESLANGYINRPDMTAERFIESPFHQGERLYDSGDLGRLNSDGIMEFFGRADEQMKVNGFRIEPGEIETILTEYDGISEVAVMLVEPQKQRAKEEVRHCRNCGLASNHPDAEMDDNEICGICRNYDKHRKEAQRYFKTREEFVDIIQRLKNESNGKQDCIMLLSGGKDSSYVLYQLVELGLNPLVFSMDNGYISEQAKGNIRRVVDDLGLELVWGKTPAMNEIFVESLNQFSNVCNGCFKAIYTLSINLARERGIRHIVTGLSRGQFFETRIAELFKNKIFDPDTIDKSIIQARKAYHRVNDTVSRRMDVKIFEDDKVFEEIQFLDYYRYCDVRLEEMLEFLDKRAPWVRPTDTGRSTNCLINEAGIYVHKREKGYHNYALPYSWDVRLGHKERNAALEELDDNIDEKNVQKILNEIGYIEKSEQDMQLVAYFVSSSTIAPSDLREFLTDRLPRYMIPSHFIAMESFPLNSTGKLDRKALPGLTDVHQIVSANYAEPEDDIQEQLVQIWQEVLQCEKVGINDNFLELGGTSLHAITIVAKTMQEFEMKLPLHLLFETPSVASMSAYVEDLLLSELEALDEEEAIKQADELL